MLVAYVSLPYVQKEVLKVLFTVIFDTLKG